MADLSAAHSEALKVSELAWSLASATLPVMDASSLPSLVLQRKI
jgi:hypothetical protein